MTRIKFNNILFDIDVDECILSFTISWIFQEFDHDGKIYIGLKNAIYDLVRHSKNNFSYGIISRNENDFITPNLVLKFSDESELNRFLIEYL